MGNQHFYRGNRRRSLCPAIREIYQAPACIYNQRERDQSPACIYKADSIQHTYRPVEGVDTTDPDSNPVPEDALPSLDVVALRIVSVGGIPTHRDR